MKIKSYYAATIEGAVASASQELGPEAVLITSKRSGPEARHLGEYEVVFGVESPAGGIESRTSHTEPAPDVKRVVDGMRREMEELRRSLTSAWRTTVTGQTSPEIAYADHLLTLADVAPELKQDILIAIADRMREETATLSRNPVRDLRSRLRPVEPSAPQIESKARAIVRDWLYGMLRIDSTIGVPGNSNKIVALVGPPGAGKTATLVKLAVQHGLNTRKPSLIVSTDTYRVAATDQLRAYAALIGIAFVVAESPASLGQILDEHRTKELILIDTPGLGPADVEASSDMSRFLSLHPAIDVHLVVPASLRSADLVKTATRFAPFGPGKLIATKADETDIYGSIVSQSILLDLPVSYVTAGQRIPDDLEVATKERLLAFAASEEIEAAAVTAA